MTALNFPSAAPYEHWLNLSPSDWEKVFRYIPMLEAVVREDNLSEVAIQEEVEVLKWTLYIDLAFLGLVYDFEAEGDLMNKLENPASIEGCDYLIYCKLLALMTQGNNFSNGYFDRKIKDMTLLTIIVGIQNCLPA